VAGMSQQQFMSQIRSALQDGRPSPELRDPSLARVVRSDAPLVDQFVRYAEQAGMKVLRTGTAQEARNRVIRTAQSLDVRTALLAGPTTPIDDLLREEFTSAGIRMLDPKDLNNSFQADLAVTGVHAAIAETGSLVLYALPDAPRLPSLAVPAHIAIVRESQILADLLDWAEWGKRMPPCTSHVLITGPSKTGDIEMNLVTGVHGPGQLYVVLMANH
jgi:L-lactate dehydrogenase complex protein LldG